MLKLKTKQVLSEEAHTLASSFEMVRFRSNSYMPANYETFEYQDALEPEDTVWVPVNRSLLQRLAAAQFNTLFSTDRELASFDFMVSQSSRFVETGPPAILVRSERGLLKLDQRGQLLPADGQFVPNFIQPVLNEDVAEKDRVFNVLVDWVGGEEEAHSLLYHFATCLAPGYSAVKYVLLLGAGRNGKGLLLKMLLALLGRENVSSISRQFISENNPATVELNGKLLNLIFDGSSNYIKDSGPEKTLTAGEPHAVRMLYDSSSTLVQTNALFVEALNHEPKSKDKSSALQKRLVRFHFGKTFALDRAFEKQMLSPESLGAFLSLLIDHYVVEEDLAEKLALTNQAKELQQEHQLHNSLAMQYLLYLDDNKTGGYMSVVNQGLTELTAEFRSWRLTENDISSWSEQEVLSLFRDVAETARKTVATEKGPRKQRIISELRPDTITTLETLKEIDNAEDDSPLVGD